MSHLSSIKRQNFTLFSGLLNYEVIKIYNIYTALLRL